MGTLKRTFEHLNEEALTRAKIIAVEGREHRKGATVAAELLDDLWPGARLKKMEQSLPRDDGDGSIRATVWFEWQNVNYRLTGVGETREDAFLAACTNGLA